ncbi:MAG: hypothetical protein JWR35_3077 [Marmoricola sp.]|jgi:iron-sulfur cluster assembly protein|nr:hypothetical protein [Marmoricola sp.]
MLTMTENATEVVKRITEANVAEQDAGLRITQETESPDSLSLAPVPAPEVGDAVVEANGARIFLDEAAAASLDDKVLDARIDENGGVQFAVAIQGMPS